MRYRAAVAVRSASGTDSTVPPNAVPPNATGAVTVVIRPEQIQLDRVGSEQHGSGEQASTARVTRVRYGGHDALVELTTDGGHSVQSRVPSGRIPGVGDLMVLRVTGTGVVYPAPGWNEETPA